MKNIRFFSIILLGLNPFISFSQDSITVTEASRIINILASDSMKGRGNGSAELDKAAQFIASEFEMDSMLYFPGGNSFFQPFFVKKQEGGGPYVLRNVVGVLEGKTRPNEVIIFSAHYDHVGVEPSVRDSIFNGANDNASGTTALLMLAHYFAERKDNERTLIFCAFAGEELGLLGSSAFSGRLKSEAIVAVINIEMIGVSSSGKNAFYITGSGYSDLSRILKNNLKRSGYKIVREPSYQKNLFQRSDNFPFAQKGIPVHSIMSSDDEDKCYHKPCDEVKRIDIANMTSVIKAIALSVKTLIDGSDTPKRIKW